MSRYACDTYYLETRDALVRIGIDPDEFARRTGVLLLKPDAAVTGGMSRSICWLTRHGYRVVAARAVNLGPLHLRALWYFNWHKATPERRRLADQLAAMTPSIVLLVTHPDTDQPVSVRVTADKGPADPALREPGQLRHALAAGTYLLNQVHTPDDPDDVLREMSIYFPESELAGVLGAVADGTDIAGQAMELAQQVESGVPRRSGDLEVARDTVWQHLRAGGATVEPRTAGDWLSAVRTADERHIPIDPWFRMVLESAYLPMHRLQ
ncbi:nucleoside-diphosphate kinase [Mycobacterium sp. C31M]